MYREIFTIFRKLLKYCGTTIPYPMWNHLTKLYYKVEKFTKKCGTNISIHTKYYGKPSGTIAVPLVNVEPFSPYSSHMWNHFPNSYLILWKTKWNQFGSTLCLMQYHHNVEPKLFHNFPSSDTTLYNHALQCSMTFWAGKIVEPIWFHIVAIQCSITRMWNQNGSTIFPAQKVILHYIATLYSVV